MGNCFGRESRSSHVGSQPQPDFLKPISLPPNLVLICLDGSPTPESSRLKTALKGAFGNLVAFNSERGLLDHIKMTVVHKYFIVLAGKVGERTVQSLVNNPKVIAIYLCLGKPKLDQIPKTTKIKGFFEKRMELNRAIYHDVRAN